MTAKADSLAEIALPRGPKKPILNLGLLCGWRDAALLIIIIVASVVNLILRPISQNIAKFAQQPIEKSVAKLHIVLLLLHSLLMFLLCKVLVLHIITQSIVLYISQSIYHNFLYANELRANVVCTHCASHKHSERQCKALQGK